MKSGETYKTSNQKYIDSFKVVKLLLENKDKLLEPIPYDEKIMNTQFYDKVTTYNTLEYPQSCVKYQHYEPKKKLNSIKFILILKQLLTRHINRISYAMKQKMVKVRALLVKIVLLICLIIYLIKKKTYYVNCS